MHIRMPGGDGCDPNALPQPYPGSTTSRLWSGGLNYGPHFRGRADQAQDGTLWEREVLPQIERIVAWVVLLSRREPLRLLRESAARQAACE